MDGGDSSRASRMHRASLLLVAAALLGPGVALTSACADRATAIMARKAAAAGKQWGKGRPAIGAQIPPGVAIQELASSTAFSGWSCGHFGDYYECTIYDDEMIAGRVLYNLGGDDELVGGLERLLGARCVEITHIDVAETRRGLGGGPLLLQLMTSVLDLEGDIAFVKLQHDNRNNVGSGRGLIRWYESLGFEPASTLFPRSSATSLACGANDMVASMLDLKRSLGDIDSPRS